jgi:hypothetical protein
VIQDNFHYRCYADPTAPANACLRPPGLGEEVLRRSRKTSQEAADFIDYYFGGGALTLVAARWTYTGKLHENQGDPNKDNARLVAESGAASKSLREARAHGEQIREALDRMRADHVRLETERDALRATVSAQSGELESARASLGVATAERTKLAAQVDAQMLLLADYRVRLGLGGAAG